MEGTNRDAETDGVRRHYDRLSLLYRWLWGNHIHHGLWFANESQTEAQLQLIEKLATKTGALQNTRVLDIGCGLGGSSIWLAEKFNCSVTGITISPVQQRIATRAARRAGLTDRISFKVHDANHLRFKPESFDTVWIIECSEHLADKKTFLKKCFEILRPGGRLALCAWLAAEHGSETADEPLVREVCDGMLCPSLGTAADYRHWISSAGFIITSFEDLTRQVERTWEICQNILRRPAVRSLLRFMAPETRRFTSSFASIRRAYAKDAMAYGMLSATKPNQFSHLKQ